MGRRWADGDVARLRELVETMTHDGDAVSYWIAVRRRGPFARSWRRVRDKADKLGIVAGAYRGARLRRAR